MKFIVMCERSGGPTGFGQAPLRDGKKGVIEFETREAAQARAEHLNREMNHAYAVATFRYWVEQRWP